jgi:hypothetical protein
VNATIPLPMAIEGVQPIDGEANLLGHVHVLGVLHHAWFVQVRDAAGEQIAVHDPHERLDDLHYVAGDGGPFQTVQLPDFTGEYVLVLAPSVR